MHCRRSSTFHVKVGKAVWPVMVHLHDLGLQEEESLLKELWKLVESNHEKVFPSPWPVGGAGASSKGGRVDERLTGERIQVTYQHRPTSPHFTCLTYEGDGFGHLPLSRTTVILWVFPYDPTAPDRPLPVVRSEQGGNEQQPSQLITRWMNRQGDQQQPQAASSSSSTDGGGGGGAAAASTDPDAPLDLTLHESDGDNDDDDDDDATVEDVELQSALARSLRDK